MEKIMSVYWFVILFIVAGAIVYMVSNFYGDPYDVRELESNALVYQIANCISPELYLDTSIFENSEDFFSYCKLTLKTEDFGNWNNESQFFISVEIYDFYTKEIVSPILPVGNTNLKDFCILQKEGRQKKLPYCLNRTFYSVDESGKQYIIQINTIIDKGEKNAGL